MKRIIYLLSLAIASSSFAFDADEIRALAEKAHSRKSLVPELKQFSDAREYLIRVRIGKPGQLQKFPETTAYEKIVEGKFRVLKFRPPGAPADIFNVVIYDKAAGVYRRWVMLPDGVIQRSIGVAISKTRAISWSSTEESADGIRVVGIETYDNESSSWREISMDGDKVVSINEGTATKVK